MKLILIFALFVIVGGGIALPMSKDKAMDVSTISLQYDLLHDEIVTLENTPLLPSLYENWRYILRYTSLYDNASLILSEVPTEHDTVPIKAAKKRALLSGQPRQVFAIARHIQQTVPVFFDRFSLELQGDEPLAKLVLYILGNRIDEGSHQYSKPFAG